MLTSNIVVSSQYGSGATVSKLSATGKSSTLATYAARADSFTATGGLGRLSPAASSAMNRIFDLVSQLEDVSSRIPSGAARQYLSNNQDAGAWQVAATIQDASMTKDDVVEWLQSADYAQKPSGLSESEIAMHTALANGTATVVDMEEFGIRSEMTREIHFDHDGNFRGSSTRYDNDHAAIVRFMDENMELNGAGQRIDKATGRSAGIVTYGAVQIYITWP